MIKKTIEISENATRLSLKRRQLVVTIRDEGLTRQFACEDIGVLILQNRASSITTAALDALLAHGAAVVICNEKHLPSGILLPTQTHTELVPRMAKQLEAGLPAKKRAWQHVVRAKIRAQAKQLPPKQAKKLDLLAANLLSGDPHNHEAQAAKIYWPARFPHQYLKSDVRDCLSDSLFNALLNYGYAILRAATARAIVSAGLHPALGIFHHRRDNSYCLADDLMEPFRPMVDEEVASILSTPELNQATTLERLHRQRLLNLLVQDMSYDDAVGPLMAVLPRYINSYFRFLTKQSERFPVPTCP